MVVFRARCGGAWEDAENESGRERQMEYEAQTQVAKNFGKGGGFACGLIFPPFIFYPILGFGSAQYAPVAPAQAA